MRKFFLIATIFFALDSMGQSPMSRLLKKSTPAPFTPASAPNLIFWVKADQITGLSDGDPVSTWEDQSGNGFDATQSGSNRPTYKTGILNSLPVVRFLRSSVQTMTAPIGVQAQPYTLFIVVKFTNFGATNMYALDGGNQNGGIVYNGVGTTAFGLYAGGSVLSISATNTNWNYVGAVYNGASTIFSLNGTESSPGNPGTSSITNLTIGEPGGVSSGAELDGDIAEIIYYSGIVSSGDRILINGYLAAKYGL